MPRSGKRYVEELRGQPMISLPQPSEGPSRSLLDEAIALISSILHSFHAFSCEFLELQETGSTAKGTEVAESDLDLVAVFDAPVLRESLRFQLFQEARRALAYWNRSASGAGRILLLDCSKYVQKGIYESAYGSINFDFLVASSEVVRTRLALGVGNSAGLSASRAFFISQQPDHVREGIRRLKEEVWKWGLPDTGVTSYFLEVLTVAAVQNDIFPSGVELVHDRDVHRSDVSGHYFAEVEEQAIELGAMLFAPPGQGAVEVHWHGEVPHLTAVLKRGKSCIVLDPLDPTNNLARRGIESFACRCQEVIEDFTERRGVEDWTPEEIGWYGDPDCWDIAAGCSSD